jgi:putative aldouronate transport system permease protein
MAKAKTKLTPEQKAHQRAHIYAHIKKYGALYVMMILPLLYFLIFKYMPMIGNILAFRRYRPGKGMFGTEWTLRYFERFLKDPAFWRAFRNTLVISLENLAINFPLPIIFAILLNEVQNKVFKKMVQTVSYMPRFISTVVVIAIMNELLSPSSGLINTLLTNMFGMQPVYFMNDAGWFRPLYILSESWQYTGWTAIIYLAAITGINSDLYEAAEMDGANRMQQIFHVTIPSILPTIMVMLIMNIGRLLSIGYEKILLMYTPTNSGVSDIIDTLVYRTGLQNQNYSYATAIGLFGGIIGLILVSGANAASKKLTGDGLY